MSYTTPDRAGNSIFKWVALGLVVLLSIILLVSLGSIYENNEAGEILVVQAPFSGELSVYTDPGMKWQGWGTVTHYKRSNWFDFEREGVQIRFNDGGHAVLKGGAQYDLPL